MVADSRRKVGLFGGTFDPVHKGHVAVAEYVLDQVPLDDIYFIPAPHPPHKSHIAAPFHHRVAMLELALEHHQACHISLIESEYDGPSYTIHTVRKFKEQKNERYVLIIGADSLVDLPGWYQADQLIRSVDFIVVSRHGVDHDKVKNALHRLDASYTYDSATQLYHLEDGHFIRYLDGVHWPVSSSALRNQLAKGDRVSMIDNKVLSYIHKHHLYCSPLQREIHS